MGAVVLVLAAAVCPAGAQPKGHFPNETLKVDGQERVFRLFVPRGLDASKPAPLVIAFHGMLIDSKDLMPVYTKLGWLAHRENFILAFPEAVNKSWGLRPKKIKADLAFYDAMVADISGRYRVDPNRIYVLGMSNGGYFAHLLAKERSGEIAAVCSHSGPLGLQTLGGIRAKRKFPVMIVHGTKDPIFPVAFARENRDKYRREGHEVEYVEVEGLKHMWATQEKINDRIWEFFQTHPLK